MSAPSPEIPHQTGSMTESEAVDRLLAKGRAGMIPDPKSEEELLDERDQDGGEFHGEPEAEEPEVEPDLEVEGEPDDEMPTAASSDPVVKFDDGTELTLSEVKRGYLRQQDYTRKTQETAELRKGLEAQRTQFDTERKAVAERLTPLIQQAEAILANPAMQQELHELRVTDPGAYAVKVMELQQQQATVQRLQYEQAQLREQAEREAAERFQHERAETAKQSRETLMREIPAAKKDFAGWYQQLGKYVLEQGIPVDAWDNEVDHRVITMAWKAMQYDNATRKTPATNEKLRKAPQPMRPGAAKPPGYAQQRALREATERAAASGSIEDAVELQRLKMRARR